MEKATLSFYQLFTLKVLFGIATAMMFTLGGDAKQASWIAILLGMTGGLFTYGMYYHLYRRYSMQPLTAYSKEILGKPIGSVIGLAYIAFFLYGASRNVRDGVELVSLSYTETPGLALGIILMIVVVYGLFQGIEVISRVGELYILLFGTLTVLAIIALFGSGVVMEENLLPVLEPGWKAILQTVRDETWTWPFGEMVCFTMLLPYLNQPKSGLKVGILGILVTGFYLALVHGLEVAVLGVDRTGRSIFPFLEMSQKINVGDVIQRLDAFVMVTLIINVFFKISIYLYAAVIAATDLFTVTQNKVILPMGAIVLATSILFTGSIVGHVVQGSFVLKNIFPIFGAYIPLLLWVGSFIRKKKGS